MSFETYEASQQLGRPVELYTFAIGSSSYTFNNGVDTLVVGGVTYAPLAGLSRGTIQRGGPESNLDITLPADHDFCQLYTNIAPGQKATVTLLRVHRNDTGLNTKVLFKGCVQSLAYGEAGATAQVHVASIETSLDKEIPGRTFQAACNNVLFDSLCQVIKNNFKFTGTISAVSGNTVTVPGLTAAKGANWAESGYIAYGTYDYRQVLSQSGDDLKLILPFHTDVTGQGVIVYAGCRHVITECNTKFANADNYGGCPFIPTKNIFATGLK